ncbi:amidohydrolase [Naasia lichenicola]|uniref:Amidohydrolase n=2 Tax=Naasia lichenicola TaxID=2565933 RepID=A0A4V3WTW7_9MICO|nr:amidohydrolase [Naasia lichenicola]
MPDPKFDAIFVGGSAFTAGWERSRPLGVGVRDGRIAAIAQDDELRAAGGGEVVELRGGMVLAAFHDAHAHPIAGAIELLLCDVSGEPDAESTLNRIAAYAQANPDVPWIRGGGWTMSHFAGGTPSRTLLDAIVPDRPVVLLNRDHHGSWVNSRALEAAGIAKDTPDPADGRIERDADGSPSGVLHEGAMRLLDGIAPAVPDELAARALLRAQEDFFALGIVGWQDAYVGATAGVDDLLETYLAAVADGSLQARITAALWWKRGEGLGQLEQLIQKRERVASLGRSDVLLADAVKIMVDGVAENFTAAMSQPYRDPHGHSTGERGLTFLDPVQLEEALVALDDAGFSVHLHALGDRAVTASLDAIAAARRANGPTGLRHQLAHLQIVQRNDVARFAELGATANLQMLWAAVDDQLDELTFPFIAEELIARHYPLRELRDSGAVLAAGSDWPVSTADPMQAIHVAVNRAAPGAQPDPRMDPTQAIDLATALSAYTAGSARANGRSASTGALTTGLLADLVVLDTDPFEISPADIYTVNVRETRLSGEPVYWAEEA